MVLYKLSKSRRSRHRNVKYPWWYSSNLSRWKSSTFKWLHSLNQYIHQKIFSIYHLKKVHLTHLCLKLPSKLLYQSSQTFICKINPHKPSGPDKIPAHVLKETTPVIAPMLTYLFQHSLNTSEEWKQAYSYVTPIFKKGNKADPKNYWPVPLTSITSKRMEHTLCS